MKQEKLVPELRFNGFIDNWNLTSLGNEAILHNSSRVPLSEEERRTRKGKYRYYGASGVIDFIDGFLFEGEFILLGEDGANIIMRSSPLAFLVNGKFWVNNHAHVLQSKGSNKFLAESLERIRYEKYNTGTAQPKLNSKVIKSIKLKLPSLPEQQKIADFLTSVDRKIQALTSKVELLKDYKKGVMQKIFKQEIRFKKDDGSGDFSDWEEKVFLSFLNQRVREVPKPSSPYLALGLRSHGKGVFQKPNSDPSKIAMTSLFVAKVNDLIVNITFAWEGAIAIVGYEDDGGLVSHRFPTYQINEEVVLIEYLRFVIVQKKFKKLLDLLSPGGAGRNRVLSKKEFIKIKWQFPLIKEQTKIANFLTSINNKISTEEHKLEKMREWKKGLLQKMFV